MSRLVESCPGNGKTALFAGNAGSGPGALLRVMSCSSFSASDETN